MRTHFCDMRTAPALDTIVRARCINTRWKYVVPCITYQIDPIKSLHLSSKLFKQSALFDLQGFLVVVLLFICTCTYLFGMYPTLFDEKEGFRGIAYKVKYLFRWGGHKTNMIFVSFRSHNLCECTYIHHEPLHSLAHLAHHITRAYARPLFSDDGAAL